MPLREQWRIQKSLDAYCLALDLDPESWAAHANDGLLLVPHGELEQGLQHCRQAVRLAPTEALPRQNLCSLIEYGSIEKAMAALGEALKLSPGSPDLAMVIGAAWTEMADYAEAHRWFARALQLDPQLTEARCRAADVLLEARDADAAAQAYREVVEKEPEHVEAMAGLARTQLDQG
jgi:protein O-GlcNAc transferase